MDASKKQYRSGRNRRRHNRNVIQHVSITKQPSWEEIVTTSENFEYWRKNMGNDRINMWKMWKQQ